MSRPQLSVIIVSYNTKSLTAQTIASVFGSIAKGGLKKSDLEVIVVDNDSGDGTVAYLKKAFDGQVDILANKENTGFAKANNQGVRRAKGEFVLLLNSDTIVQENSLSQMIECLKGSSRIGIVAAGLANPDGSHQPQGGHLPTLTNVAAWWLWPFAGIAPGVKPYQDPRPVTGSGFVARGWVGGTALMMRRSVFEAVGGLDEHIFMYAEDVDLCLRIERAGLKVGICPEAVITHLGSASSSSSKARLGEVKGILYLFKKHKSEWQTSLLRLILVKGAIYRLLYFGILKGSGEARRLYSQTLAAALK